MIKTRSVRQAGRGPTVQRGADEERERVLRAAAAVFRHVGYEGATIREIAEACGTKPGTLHYRYPNKDSILVDLMRFAIGNISSRVREAVANERDPLLRIRAALRQHIGYLTSESDVVYALLFDWRSLRGEGREQIVAQRDAYEQLWASLVADLAASGVLRRGVNLRMLAYIGFGAGNWVATWYRDGGSLDSDAIADSIWETIAFGIVGDEYRVRYFDAP